MILANQVNIDKLIKSRYHKGAGVKYLAQKECLEIFYRDAEILTEKEAIFCFGMSKMPVVNCTKDIIQYKKIIKNVEFYEMIGRAAELKFKDKTNVPLE